jgi:hypothetical protein
VLLKRECWRSPEHFIRRGFAVTLGTRNLRHESALDGLGRQRGRFPTIDPVGPSVAGMSFGAQSGWAPNPSASVESAAAVAPTAVKSSGRYLVLTANARQSALPG